MLCYVCPTSQSCKGSIDRGIHLKLTRDEKGKEEGEEERDVGNHDWERNK